jgi:hypothetical protein
MKKYKIQPIISLNEPKRSLSMCAFWRTAPKEHHMYSGFLLEYVDKVNPQYTDTFECLDSDNVWDTLEALGYQEEFRNLLIKLC